jgi:hypothetical protein
VPAGGLYYNDIMALTALGVVYGHSDGTFHPDSNVSRGQLAKIVVKAFNLPEVTAGGPHFSDVPVGSVFYNYIETLFNKGIMRGYSDGTFHPDSNVSRGQLAKVIVKAAGWAPVARNTPTFSDVSIGSTYYGYIEAAVEHGVLRGYGDGTFRPERAATRGQVARIALNSAPLLVSQLPDSIMSLLRRICCND